MLPFYFHFASNVNISHGKSSEPAQVIMSVFILVLKNSCDNKSCGSLTDQHNFLHTTKSCKRWEELKRDCWFPEFKHSKSAVPGPMEEAAAL